MLKLLLFGMKHKVVQKIIAILAHYCSKLMKVIERNLFLYEIIMRSRYLIHGIVGQ